jgi:hypothetical protein
MDQWVRESLKRLFPVVRTPVAVCLPISSLDDRPVVLSIYQLTVDMSDTDRPRNVVARKKRNDDPSK